MKKVIHPYDVVQVYSNGRRRRHPVFCKIEYTDGRLSITGVVDPYPSGNAWGDCGQIIMDFKEFDKRGWLSVNDVIPTNGMNRKSLYKFLKIWDEWHLNDMHSECEHQQELGWTYDEYHGEWLPDLNAEPDEAGEYPLKHHPYLGHACPVCGYRIGSAWTMREVPADVLEFLQSLPDTDRTPNWV